MPRPFARLSDELHGLEKVALGARTWWLRSALIEATAILQFQMLIEAEEVGSAHSSIGPRHVLALIVEIGKRKCVLGGEGTQVLKGILRIIRRIIGANCHTCDSQRFEIVGIIHNAIDGGLHIGAVIADEHNERAMLAFEVVERVGLSIRGWKPETRGLVAKLAFRW